LIERLTTLAVEWKLVLLFARSLIFNTLKTGTIPGKLEELFVKTLLIALLAGLFSLPILAACSQEAPAPPAPKPSEQSIAPTEPAKMNAEAPGRSGTVMETMDALNYTYLKVDTGTETFWAATNKTPIKVGDAVVVPEGTPMADFHSKELDRTFDVVYFVSSVLVGGETGEPASGSMPAGHPSMTGGSTKVTKTDVDLTGIKPAEGGVTVADIYAKKETLTGTTVKVRGKVVKYSPQIMQKNWLHIQDGTGAEGSNDLTVTAGTEAKVGDTVVVTGVLSANVDFGYGYQYDLIIENAEVIIE
jgi:hypothetical protein